MDAMQIGSLILLVMLLIMVFPRVKSSLKESPKGSSNEWFGFGFLILGVAVFVYLLMSLV